MKMRRRRRGYERSGGSVMSHSPVSAWLKKKRRKEAAMQDRELHSCAAAGSQCGGAEVPVAPLPASADKPLGHPMVMEGWEAWRDSGRL